MAGSRGASPGATSGDPGGARGGTRTLLRLLGDHLVLDFGVGRFRHDLLADQFVFALIRPALDDLRGVGIASRAATNTVSCAWPRAPLS